MLYIRKTGVVVAVVVVSGNYVSYVFAKRHLLRGIHLGCVLERRGRLEHSFLGE